MQNPTGVSLPHFEVTALVRLKVVATKSGDE